MVRVTETCHFDFLIGLKKLPWTLLVLQLMRQR